MYKELLMICLLMAAVLVSGCVQTNTGSQQQDTGGASIGPGSDLETSAYDQIEQELEQATENLDLGDLENELVS